MEQWLADHDVPEGVRRRVARWAEEMGGEGLEVNEEGVRLEIRPAPGGWLGCIEQGPPAAWLRHEVANALGAAAGWIEMARREPARSPLALRRAGQAIEAAGQWLHAWSQQDEPAHVLSVDEQLRQVAASLQVEAERRGIHLQVAAASHALVHAPPGRFRSIVWNLLRNALEASAPGTTVRLEALTRGQQVLVTVQDQGSGMSDEEARRAFESGYSTKGRERGVGLSVVRAAVDAIGGRLRVGSTQGVGTRVRVELPRAERPAPVASDVFERGAVRAHVRSGNRKAGGLDGLSVLLVEDDVDLRELTAMVLRRAGARVHAVAAVREALAHQEPFDVLVADEHLPDGSGQALWSQLGREERVRAAVLVSGSPDVLGGAPGTVVLRKPFTPAELLEAVRTARGPLQEAAG